MGPSIVVFSLFVILNLLALFQSWRKWRSFVPLTNELSAMTQTIAREMGVTQINCVVNKSSLNPSPSAKVVGLWPRNVVIFTKGSLRFLADHREYAEVIIAHEIGHLEHDSRRLWRYGILSRLGLVGTAFLSALVDSVKMEDYGDNFALRYLNQKPTPTNWNDTHSQTATQDRKSVCLLRNAVHAMETCEYPWREARQSGMPFAATGMSDHNVHYTGSITKKDAWFKTIMQALKITYQVYFHTDMYEYIHREAQYRGTFSDAKTNAGMTKKR